MRQFKIITPDGVTISLDEEVAEELGILDLILKRVNKPVKPKPSPKVFRPILFVDGGCSGNGGPMKSRRMISVVADQFGKVLSEEKNNGGSNNIAEFIALKNAIKYAIEQGWKEVEIITDSMNNTHWFKKLKQGKQNDFAWVKKIKDEIDILKQKIEIDLIWRPREENRAGHYIEEQYNL
jgi:ribonuclease HI